jgi:hypothetical protein
MRRAIFHEVVHFETWMVGDISKLVSVNIDPSACQALMSGRPSLLNFDQYDCRAPGFNPERGNALEIQHMKGYCYLR